MYHEKGRMAAYGESEWYFEERVVNLLARSKAYSLPPHSHHD
jgi:hypothetical protein